MTDNSVEAFITQLQGEAKLQARLHDSRVFPKGLDWLTSLIAQYPWQTLLVLSGLTTTFLTLSSFYA